MYLKQGLDLQVPQQAGTACTLSELCMGHITVVKVMRRFGCPLTRKEAREISRYSEELEKMGVRLVGVGFDTSGASGFGLGGFWNGELFLDENRGVYDFFGLKRLGKLSSLLALLQKETRKKGLELLTFKET
ncbi:hypothetical protein DSO57_1000271 [Entomophthora muscae]|uniref:Uncharacterized protein n=1 Tax=Entomophthora muscae TaxID=34485 RepID=A0ACC2SYM6_9FUNG|nr:hypothetical protein DSO57_1000271 [Entomophthora muscae]